MTKTVYSVCSVYSVYSVLTISYQQSALSPFAFCASLFQLIACKY